MTNSLGFVPERSKHESMVYQTALIVLVAVYNQGADVKGDNISGSKETRHQSSVQAAILYLAAEKWGDAIRNAGKPDPC